MREQKLIRYVKPLREGGSLPGLAEADDGFMYVVKFKGSGHGVKALIAELIGGRIASLLGLNVPELVFLNLGEEFGRTEADEEIQDLLRGSEGLNIGLHFLSGAFTMDAYVNPVDALTASLIVWLDSYLTNVDRTPRNTNLLQWHQRETWLIDHGASLVFQHSWSDPVAAAASPFAFIKNHALLGKASRLKEAAEKASKILNKENLREIVESIPEGWLKEMKVDLHPEQIREVYLTFLVERLKNNQIFTDEAIRARAAIV